MSEDNGKQDYDAIIVGAGFSGMYMLHRLRGLGLSARVFESGESVGGTWYHNRYPGARCDSPSNDYQYSFSPELELNWHWSERFPSQPEILAYLNYAADKLDLRSDIQLETKVERAVWNEDTKTYSVTTSDGKTQTARYFISGAGCLSQSTTPQFKGLSDYEGELYHTRHWPKEPVDFTGKTAIVIGTGSSGVQVIPSIAPDVKHLTVMQRTPCFAFPAKNRPLTDAERNRSAEEIAAYHRKSKDMPAGVWNDPGTKAAFDVSDEERLAIYEERYARGGHFAAGSFTDLTIDEKAAETLAEFMRGKIREQIDDPLTAEMLCPTDYYPSTKRLVLEIGYYDAFNQDNVDLVDVRKNPIERFTEKGIVAGGVEYEAEIVVLATGFDAMTGSYVAFETIGTDGRSLAEHWHAGPLTYLGYAVHGFPNMFLISGPGSPSVLTNVPRAIEQSVDKIADLIEDLKRRAAYRAEPTAAAEQSWVENCNTIANATLMPRANSWYMGANVPGKPQVFMPFAGGMPLYDEACEQERSDGYPSFEVETRASALTGTGV